MAAGLSSATDFLRDAVKAYLVSTYANPPVKCDEVVDDGLGWVPTLHCPVNNQLMLIEASEKPYPAVFRMRRVEMADVQAPIAVYAACPEEAYTHNQKEASDLAQHGFGLFTVDANGSVTCKFHAIPIAQHISDAQFKSDIEGFPAPHKRRSRECFELYKHNAPSGVANIAELLEGMVVKAAKESARKGWLTTGETKAVLQTVLATMQSKPQFQNADAILGASRIFVSRYRNAAHHFPKNKKQAWTKYRDCRHAFLDGLRNVRDLKAAMKALGLSGGF